MARTIAGETFTTTVDLPIQNIINKNNAVAPASAPAQTGMSTAGMVAWGLGGLAVLSLIALGIKKILKK